MNNIVAIIPARSGSKSIIDKNIKKLSGHPLLAYSIAAAKKSKKINKVIVSTDSKQYAEIAKHYGAEVPFLRPSKISDDKSSDFEFISHSLDQFKKMKFNPDYIVHLRPTTPIREPYILDKAISFFQNNKDFHSLRSVHLMSESSYKTLEIHDGTLKPLSFLNEEFFDANAPRQSLPDTYQANGYIDVLSTSFILKNHEIHGKKILPFVTKPAYELDLLEDLDYLEYQISKSSDIIKKLFE